MGILVSYGAEALLLGFRGPLAERLQVVLVCDVIARYSVFSLYWYKSTNSAEALRLGFRGPLAERLQVVLVCGVICVRMCTSVPVKQVNGRMPVMLSASVFVRLYQ